MKGLIGSLKQGGGYWRDVIRVAGGTVLAQSVSVVGYILLGNIYGSASFGTYASWFSVAAIVGAVASGALETSFVLDDDGADRRRATVRTIMTAGLGSAIVLLLLIPAWLLSPRLLVDIGFIGTLLIAVGGLLLSVNLILQSWAAASGHFTQLNRSRLVQGTATTGLPVLFGLVNPEPRSLILGFTLGLLVTVLFWWPRFEPTVDLIPTRSELVDYWRLRKRYFLFVLPAIGISAVIVNLPVLVVKSRFGPELAGILALTIRVLGAPTSLLGVAVRDVFRRHASVAFRARGECRREFVGSFVVLGALSAVSMVGVVLLSESFFRILFGPEWAESGTVAIWLVPMFALAIVASPLSYMVYIASREQYDLIWQSTLLVVVAVSLVFAPTFRSAILSYSLGYSFMYVAYLALCYRMSLGPHRSLLMAQDGPATRPRSENSHGN